jgi:gliding motility-associated-like protein
VVQAFNANGTITASSQVACLFTNVLTEPVFNYVRVASVAGPTQVDLKGYVDVAADVIRYDFYREDTLIGPWTMIGSTPANPPVSLVTFSDPTPITGKQSYYYKMEAIDSCGADVQTSNIDKTIFLQAISNDEITNTLYWNDYYVWLGGVLYYNIYRSIDGVLDPVPIATVPFTNSIENSYVDDVSSFTNFIGKFSYRIEAVEGPGNIYNFADTSYSNIAEVIQKPLVYVPNAFTPNGNGMNDVFIPSSGFVDIDDYDFTIFNRWGEVLFETHDRTEGWNGRFKGHKCEPDVYVWLLTFKTASGQYIDMKGTVTLLR